MVTLQGTDFPRGTENRAWRKGLEEGLAPYPLQTTQGPRPPSPGGCQSPVTTEQGSVSPLGSLRKPRKGPKDRGACLVHALQAMGALLLL